MDGYQQIRPVEAFRALVDAYWINRPGAAGAEESVLPDGCIDLIFRGARKAGGCLRAR